MWGFLLLWVFVASAFIGVVAEEEKNRPFFLWFWTSFFITPFLAAILLAGIGTKEDC